MRAQKSTGSKRKEISAGLPSVKFPCFPGNGGNVHAGKELAPGFYILFLWGWHKQMPQLQGLFRAKVLKQYLKRILDKRVFGELWLCMLLSDCFHSVAEIAVG